MRKLARKTSERDILAKVRILRSIRSRCKGTRRRYDEGKQRPLFRDALYRSDRLDSLSRGAFEYRNPTPTDGSKPRGNVVKGGSSRSLIVSASSSLISPPRRRWHLSGRNVLVAPAEKSIQRGTKRGVVLPLPRRLPRPE